MKNIRQLRRTARSVAIACVMLASMLGCRNKEPSKPSTTKKTSDVVRAAKETDAKGDRVMTFKLASSAFKDGQAIASKHTGEGADLSPPLTWDGAPAGSKEFALVCDDPDAPTPEPWVHWIIYGIGPDVRALPEGVKSNVPQLNEAVVARQGKNSWPSGVTTGYRGPLPPPGHGIHHYHFKLYALDKRLDLAPAATKQQLLEAMKGHVLGEAELVGTYERK
jgi:Raf kinase inhibitor-like YbhB/YbcL family protein